MGAAAATAAGLAEMAQVAMEPVMATVVQAVPMAQPASVPMMATIPDGVAPGGQFMLQTPSGGMMVTAPPGTKPGDSIQVMVPAASAAGPVNPPGHPGAYSMSGKHPEAQERTLHMPQPVYRTGKGAAPANPDALTGHFHTESPHAQRMFLAPNENGIMTENDFDAATVNIHRSGPNNPRLARAHAISAVV